MNIEKMSLSELKHTLARVEAEIPRAKAREAQAVREQVTKLLEAKGLRLIDVMGPSGSGRRSTKGRTVPAKYQDPKTGKTWAGRGRQPGWFDKRHPERFQVAESA